MRRQIRTAVERLPDIEDCHNARMRYSRARWFVATARLRHLARQPPGTPAERPPTPEAGLPASDPGAV